MKISKIEKQWFVFGDEDSEVEFQIRPCAFSTLKLGDTGVDLNNQFLFCLCDWKGLKDENDKPFKYDDINKQYLYDYYMNIREFIFTKASKIREALEAEIKN